MEDHPVKTNLGTSNSLSFYSSEGDVSHMVIAPHVTMSPGLSRDRLLRAITLATNYLVTICDEEGRFRYRVNLNPNVGVVEKYNIIRHAAAIYALGLCYKAFPEGRILEAMRKAGEFLKHRAISPVPENPEMLAVWSLPKIESTRSVVQAKLGGTGLGLLGLLSLEDAEPGHTPLEYIRQLGDFLLFMQKEDGGFFSKYYPFKRGKTGEWQSLYYPGEAALGLLALNEKDPSPKWLQGAANALSYLAQQRADSSRVPPDHWTILATAKILPVLDRCDPPVPRGPLIRHTVQICQSLMPSREYFPRTSAGYGSLDPDGRTCPTATRLEGLLAALGFLPDEFGVLKQRMGWFVRLGLGFLLRSQLQSGAWAGGIPRAIGWLSQDHPGFSTDFNRRATEIRVDYVQHTVSAMIQFARMVGHLS